MGGRSVVRCLLAAVAAAALLPSEASAQSPHRSCGTIQDKVMGEVRVVVRGASCSEAIRVVRAFSERGVRLPPWFCGLAHGEAARTVPFSCGWGGRSGDLRNWPHSIVVFSDSSGWEFPLARPVASPAAQAFMPLLFLDDDEHWPVTDPDWFFATAPSAIAAGP